MPACPMQLHKAEIGADGPVPGVEQRTAPAQSTVLRKLALRPTVWGSPPPSEVARGDGGGPPRPLPSQLQLNTYGRQGCEMPPEPLALEYVPSVTLSPSVTMRGCSVV